MCLTDIMRRTNMKYTPSINIAQTTFNPAGYIVTQNALGVIGNIVDSFNAGVHSFNIIGSYGTGKSNFILLSEKTNEYFKLLNENDFRGEIRIRQTANDSAEIRLFSSNGTYIKDPGGAQETTMYMSLLFAISGLTTLKKEENYPLIFDAPTSSFEDFKENVFYNIIDKIDKQCIIVTKDLLEVDKKTGHKTLNTEKIESMTCSVYRIEKKAGYDQEDLSTIRTIITPIK